MRMLAHEEVDDRTRIAFPDARMFMLAAATPLEAESVTLLVANGRVAARTLRAAQDIVPFARCAMDGYALRAADTDSASRGAPRVLRVTSATYAGDPPISLTVGQAVAVATGSPLPAGADAVAPFETVDFVRDTIALSAPVGAGDHVFARGDDAKRGDVLVRAGQIVTPGRAALLASAGHAAIAVHRRPRVAIVSTGNELVAVSETPRSGQIRNSNAAMLAAALERDGARVVLVEQVGDAEALLRETLQRALAASDLVITTGGASTGERDLVKGTLRAIGATFVFDSIALRPAKPTGFARFGDRLVATLPGNPAAAFVAYIALVRGVVRRLAGVEEPFRPAVPATLQGTIHRKDRRHFLMFGSLAMRSGAFTVRPLENQCSSLVRTSADANSLIVAEPGEGYLRTGDIVPVEVLDWDAVTIS